MLIKRGCFAALLGDPSISRMTGHGNMNKPSRTEFNDEKGVKLPSGK